MNEPKYSLSQEQLNSIAAIAAEKAVEAYRSEQQKTQKKQDNESIRITKKKLQSYRRVKASLAETEEFSEDEKIELRWQFVKDLMGSSMQYVDKAENIDKAMRLYKREVDNSTNDEFQRRYRVMHAMYIADEVLTIEQIAEKENTSEKTVYRDIGIACKILSVYLLGM